MTVEYELSNNDLLAFNLFVCKTSPSFMRRNIYLPQIILPFLIAVFLLVLWNRNNLKSILLGLIPSLIWFFIYPKFQWWYTKKNTLKVLNEGDNTDSVSLTLSPDKVIVKADSGEAMYKWSKINKIVETEDYIYLFITNIFAMIIPKRSFSDQSNLSIFVKTIHEFHGLAQKKVS
ncbi:MAG: hypothetical protein IEMM0008_1746 [bacterium]|nr:MAG: hypothetical protein IEMM0008_1746 [bacterium]